MFNSTNLFFCAAQPMPQAPANNPPLQPYYLQHQPRSPAYSKDIDKRLFKIIGPPNNAFDAFNADPSSEKALSLSSKAQTAIEEIQRLPKKVKKQYRQRINKLSAALEKVQIDLHKMEKDHKFIKLSIENYRDRPTSLLDLASSCFKRFLCIEDGPPVEQRPTLNLEDDHEKKDIEQSDPTSYWLRMEALLYAKKFTEVLEEMLRLIRLEPKNSRAYLIAGRCYQDLEQPRHAYSYLNQGITLDPHWPADVYFRRASAAMYIGKLVQAENDFAIGKQRGWNLAPPNEQAALNMHLGKVKFYLKKYDHAFALFEKALVLSKQLNDDKAIEIQILGFKAIYFARQEKWSESQEILNQMSKYSKPYARQAVSMTRGFMYLESNPSDLHQALKAFEYAQYLGVNCEKEIINWFILNNNPEPAELYFREAEQRTLLSADRLKANIFHLINQAPTENLKNFYFAILDGLPVSLSDSSMESLYESVNCLLEEDLNLTPTVQKSIQKFRQGIFHDSKNTPPKLVWAIEGLFDLLKYEVKTPMTLASRFEKMADDLANLFPYNSRNEAQNAIIATCYFCSGNPKKSLQFFDAVQKNAHFAWFARFAMHLVNNDIAKRDENFIATETTAYFAELLSLEKSYQRDTLISLMFISGLSALIQNSQPEGASPVIPTLIDLMLRQFGLIRNHSPQNGAGWFSYVAVGVVLLTTIVGSICMCKTRKKRVPQQKTPKVAAPEPPPLDDKEVMKYIEDSLVELFNNSSSVRLKVKKVYKWNEAFEAFIECENANLWEVLREDYLKRYCLVVFRLLGPVEARISETKDHVPGWVFKFKGSPTPRKQYEKECLKTQVEAIKELDADVHTNVQNKIDCLSIRNVLTQLFDETSSVGLAVVNVCKSQRMFEAKLECSSLRLCQKVRLEKNLEGYQKVIATLFDQVSYYIFHAEDDRSIFFRFVNSTTKVLTEDLIKTAKEEIKKQDAEVMRKT